MTSPKFETILEHSVSKAHILFYLVRPLLSFPLAGDYPKEAGYVKQPK